MKRFTALLLFVATMLLLCGCAESRESDVPEGCSLFDNEAVDYTFFYRSEWSADCQSGISSLQLNTASSSVYATYSRISVMAFDSDAESVRAYWDSYKTDIAKQYGGFAEKNTSELMLDDAAALRVSYTATIGGEEETPYLFEQVICLRNGLMYLLTFTASEDDFETCLPGFEQVVSSFEFRKDIVSQLF